MMVGPANGCRYIAAMAVFVAMALLIVFAFWCVYCIRYGITW